MIADRRHQSDLTSSFIFIPQLFLSDHYSINWARGWDVSHIFIVISLIYEYSRSWKICRKAPFAR
jgi:hypothetical protein